MQSQKEDEVKKVHLLRELESMLVQEHDRTPDQEERFSELLQSLDLDDIEKLSRKYRPDTHAAPQDTEEDEAIALALSKMDGALWGAEQELEQERMRERELQRAATPPSTDHSVPSAASRARAVQMDEQGVCHDTDLFKRFFQQLQLPMALFPPVSIAHTPTLENQQFSRSTTMPAQERERVRDRVCERDSGPHPWPLHPLQEQNFRERTPTPTPSQRDTDSEFAKQLQEEEMRAHGISFGDLEKFQEIAQNQDIFSSKTMLYVPACFAGKEVELFVDTGAQSSVISECMVREMNLSNKVNRFYRGQATGVGTASITGVVYCLPFSLLHRFFFFWCLH
jgi:hypothetical protein